jgi:hypothetical protein
MANALYSQWWNNRAAWDDWRKLAAQCDPYLVSLFAPPVGASWRVVDKCANLLKAAAQPPLAVDLPPAGGEIEPSADVAASH